MKKHIACMLLVVPLCGCLHWQDYNPFHKKEPPVIESAAPAEKIGPDVIAVPVEPVEAEDMLVPAPPADTDGL